MLSQHYSLKRQVDDRFITVETIQNHDLQDRANYRGGQLRASMLQGSARPLLDQRTSSLEVTNNTLKLLRSQGVLAFFLFKRHNEDMNNGQYKKQDTLARFWSKVDKSADCWEWLGNKAGNNHYGVFYRDGKTVMAHRFSWQLIHGSIPADLCVCHSCDNPGCVRPEHLFLGTQAANMTDRDGKGRTAVGAKNGRSKLTPEQVLHIRHLHATGQSVATLSDLFKTAKSTIRSVVTRETWNWLD